MKEFNTKSKVLSLSLSTLALILMCAVTLICTIIHPLTTLASETKESKVPPRLIGTFDYDYVDINATSSYGDDDKDYVVVYDLRTPGYNDPDLTLNYYDELYIYPVTKDSIKKFCEGGRQDPSVLEIANTPYTFEDPLLSIYPKTGQMKYVSDFDLHNHSSFKYNVVGDIQSLYSCTSGYAPNIDLHNVYLKEGLTAIPAYFLYDCYGLGIHTLTSNNLKDSKEGLPDYLEYIEKYAFSRSGITFNSLPANLKGVDEYAFEDCTLNIKELPANAIFSGDALHGAYVSGLKHLDMKNFYYGIEGANFGNEGTLTIKANKLVGYLFNDCSFNTNIKLVTNSKVVPKYCFLKCSTVKIDSISKNVKKINDEAFTRCTTVSYKGTPRLKKLFKSAEKNTLLNDSGFNTISR